MRITEWRLQRLVRSTTSLSHTRWVFDLLLVRIPGIQQYLLVMDYKNSCAGEVYVGNTWQSHTHHLQRERSYYILVFKRNSGDYLTSVFIRASFNLRSLGTTYSAEDVPIRPSIINEGAFRV